MDELQISGKRFISSRRIARENGYTSDYIGQLIRGGKIVGQKVGRAWYVDAASFDAYLGGEGAVIAAVEATEEAEEKEEITTPASRREEAPEPVEEQGALLPDPTPEAIATAIEEKKEEAAVVEMELPDLPEMSISEKEIFEQTIEEPAGEHIPLRIMSEEKNTEAATAAGGLRYYAEEVPPLPEIRQHKKISRMEDAMPAFEASAQGISEKKGAVAAARGKKSAWVALAAAGAMVFVFSALVSSALSLNLSIQEGNTAATSYSLDW